MLGILIEAISYGALSLGMMCLITWIAMKIFGGKW